MAHFLAPPTRVEVEVDDWDDDDDVLGTATVADAVDELAGWSGIADRFGAIVLQSTSEVPTA